MVSIMETSWTHSDAWVLVSLAGTSPDNTCALAEVIARADAMEHAVLTEGEFTGAIANLVAAGLAAADAAADRYWLTEAGRALYEQRTQRGRWSESVPRGLRELGRPAGAPASLPAGAFDRAVAEYQAAAERALR